MITQLIFVSNATTLTYAVLPQIVLFLANYFETSKLGWHTKYYKYEVCMINTTQGNSFNVFKKQTNTPLQFLFFCERNVKQRIVFWQTPTRPKKMNLQFFLFFLELFPQKVKCPMSNFRNVFFPFFNFPTVEQYQYQYQKVEPLKSK